jgi:hypothetical protein
MGNVVSFLGKNCSLKCFFITERKILPKFVKIIIIIIMHNLEYNERALVVNVPPPPSYDSSAATIKDMFITQWFLCYYSQNAGLKRQRFVYDHVVMR